MKLCFNTYKCTFRQFRLNPFKKNGATVNTKQWFNLFSMLFGFIPPGVYALNIALGKLPEQNIATWGMVFLLDGIGLLLAYKVYQENEDAGLSDAPLMQAGWLIASICILAAVLSQSNELKWGKIETISLLCCIASIALWVTMDAASGLWPYGVAMYASFTPQLTDYLDKPQPETWWLWLGTIVAAVLAILAAQKGKRGIKECFAPWVSLPLNAAALAIVIR